MDAGPPCRDEAAPLPNRCPAITLSRMPNNAYYTCNLLPLELVARAGFAPRWLGGHLQDPGAPARRDALSIHPMTCPYVTRLVAAAVYVVAAGPAPSGLGGEERVDLLLAVDDALAAALVTARHEGALDLVRVSR